MAKGVAYNDPFRQRRHVEQVDTGRDRLHEPHLRRRRIVGAPMIADEDVGLGGGCGQQGKVNRVVEDFDGERGGQLCLDPFARVGGDSAEKQRFHNITAPAEPEANMQGYGIFGNK